MANGIELAKAYVQIVPSATGIQQELEDELDEAGEAAGKKGGESAGEGFAGRFGEGIGKIAKVATAAMAAATAAVTGLAKEAIGNYSEYEQLVGGVETLFGESAYKIQSYASEAYKTAGLSANEYMDTVTSFSASLLQGLDGDTAAAADLANQALVDMSDNANKMGTSMESIQNAYQGFAKGNYTMLDNLKLGYGGTQAEMVRLINDSGILEEEIENLDGVSFDQIIEAVHAVQENMGITGTTAAEAESTIQGSISMTKSAWDNLLTGMAGGQNIGMLVNDLVDSVLSVANNLAPVIAEVLPNIVNGISMMVQALMPEIPPLLRELLPSLIEAVTALTTSLVEILPDLLTIIVEQLPTIVDAIVQIVPMIVESLGAMLPVIGAAGIEIAKTLIQYAVDGLPEFIPQLAQMIVDFANKLTDSDSLGRIIDTAMTILDALVDGILAALPILIENAPTIIMKLVDTITANLPKLLESGVKIIVKLVTGIINALPQLIKKGPEIVAKLVEGLASGFAAIVDAGGQLIVGLWNGIKDKGQWLKNMLVGWIGDTVSFIKKLFGIHSPSTVMAGIGEMLDAGLASGIEDNMAPIESAIDGIVQETTGELTSEINVAGSVSASRSNTAADQLGSLIGIVKGLSDKMDQFQIVLDSGLIVGTVDRGIGGNTSLATRGVAIA